MVSALALTLFLSWVQVSSNTYIVKSSAGEDRARRVLKELEGFHQLMGTLVFKTTELPELPIEVLLVGDDQLMKELAPEYNGRKVGVAGYYQRGLDRDFIVLSGRVFPETLTNIVYHELTHYFLSRALVSRPTWLNEGLAEYFAMADIREDEVALGELSSERMQLLKTNRLIPLKEFFAVDSNSPYYNERLKANAFYAQAWAFMHYMMHGDHAEDFRRYVEALSRGDANLFDYIKVSEKELEFSFVNYLTIFISRTARTHVKVSGEAWAMKIESIPDGEARMTVAEIFLAAGRIPDARRYLEAVGMIDRELTRAAYYRGILAKIAGEPQARDFFVDAMMDPRLGARAALRLVELGELHIPSVRTLLEQAAASGTRVPAVYWALSEIYLDEMHRIEESVRLARQPALPSVPPSRPTEGEVARNRYAQGANENFKYQLLSELSSGPRIEMFVPPYYPIELREQKLAGEVVVDIQLTDEGKVGALWLISADPDIFGSLATAAVREWRFEAIPAKIRVVLEFSP